MRDFFYKGCQTPNKTPENIFLVKNIFIALSLCILNDFACSILQAKINSPFLVSES